jgi:hypothetical protein
LTPHPLSTQRVCPPSAPKAKGTHQRWASTLANRSNARHRSNIRVPPTPPPPRCMFPKCGNLCGQRGRKRFIASMSLRMSHICPCTPCPSPQGYRSKVESRHFAHHWTHSPGGEGVGGQYFGRRQTLDCPLTLYPSTILGIRGQTSEMLLAYLISVLIF